MKTKYNGKEEIINNIFGTYVEPLLNDINHTALLQEWKLNLDDAPYENKTDFNANKPLGLKKIDRHDRKYCGPTSIK